MRRPFIMFHADATDFSDTSSERVRFIAPSVAEYTIEINGAGSLHIEHPLDEFGKWKTLKNGEIILAPIYRRGAEFPQPFRIYRLTKTRKNGVPTISADALHCFYDLNYHWYNYADDAAQSYTLSEWLGNIGFYSYWPEADFEWHTRMDSHARPIFDTDYWNPPLSRFTFSTNITGTKTFYPGERTVVDHLVGNSDSVVQRLNADFLCDQLTVHIDSKGTHTVSNAFNIAYGLNLVGITQTIDDSGVITLLYPRSNVEGLYPNDYVFPGDKFAQMGTDYTENGYPFSRLAFVDFNYNFDSESQEDMQAKWNKFLYTDAPGYFTKRKKPEVKYTVDLRAPQVSDEIASITGFEVGDSGTISDPDLEISTTQVITKKVVDLITQRVKSIELSNDNNALTYSAKWDGIVSSGQSALEKRISSIR